MQYDFSSFSWLLRYLLHCPLQTLKLFLSYSDAAGRQKQILMFSMLLGEHSGDKYKGRFSAHLLAISFCLEF